MGYLPLFRLLGPFSTSFKFLFFSHEQPGTGQLVVASSAHSAQCAPSPPCHLQALQSSASPQLHHHQQHHHLLPQCQPVDLVTLSYSCTGKLRDRCEICFPTNSSINTF